MTDISSVPTHAALQLSPLPSLPSVTLPASPRNGLRASAQEDEEESYTIKCVCGYLEDDGNTVYCEDCETWQHIKCYYGDSDVPDVHRCVDCEPRPVDSKRFVPRQKQPNGEKKIKRPTTKNHKKKYKDTSLVLGQPNGYGHLDNDDAYSGTDRRSGSPRDQPPPAKRTKTSHRSTHSVSVNPVSGRKRAESNATFPRSSSNSPADFSALNGYPSDFYSQDFLQLRQSKNDYTPIEANLHVNIDVTNNLSTWLTEPSALAEVTKGKTPHEVFQRWDRSMDELGTPDIKKHFDDNPNPLHLIPHYLTTESDVAGGAYIGELKGHIGHTDDYYKDTTNRWPSLRHPAPFVFFHPQLPIYIDMRVEGTHLRYARRSCNPNLKIKTIITGTCEFHFCLHAIEDIPAGSELTIGWHMDNKAQQLLSAGAFASAQNENGPPFQFQPRDDDYISRWVSTVLANFGGCACGRGPSCPMERFDKRSKSTQIDGQSPEPAKSVKGRKNKRAGTQISPLNTGLATNSRSGSEAIRADQDDYGEDSRSASSRSKRGSRDNSPMTHLSGDGSSSHGRGVSDRDLRKIKQQEKLFERMEHEELHGSRKKKRNSGGSTLNTPSAAASVGITREGPIARFLTLRQKQPIRAESSSTETTSVGNTSRGTTTAFLTVRQKQLDRAESSSAGTNVGSGSRYGDAGQGASGHSPRSNPSNSKRLAGPIGPSSLPVRTSKPNPPTYTDAITQTDASSQQSVPTSTGLTTETTPYRHTMMRSFPGRRISARRFNSAGSPLRTETKLDPMDVDQALDQPLPSFVPLPLVPYVEPTSGNNLSGGESIQHDTHKVASEVHTDVDMQDVDVDVDFDVDVNVDVDVDTRTNPPLASEMEMDVSLPKQPLQDLQPALAYAQVSSTQRPESESSSSPVTRGNFRSTDMHVTLPPPPFAAPAAPMMSNPGSASLAPPTVMSPMSVTASSSHSQVPPSFASHGSAGTGTPSLSSTKKRISLSQYTQSRNKARDIERSSPPVSMPSALKGEGEGLLGTAVLSGSAISDTPTIEKEEPKAPNPESTSSNPQDP
ncbi:MAG: hypothetical protein M1820_002810 [Bogoriella megaspora]|nr:MAG: hypothetical protein M1820_002810 [Bogoriella megaspora]